jgi:peptidase M15-like protein
VPRSGARGGFVVGLAVAAALLLTAGWTAAIADRRGQDRRNDPPPPQQPVSRTVSSQLLDPRAKGTAYLDDTARSFLDPLRGQSGKVQAAFRLPGSDLADEADPQVRAVFEKETTGAIVPGSGEAVPAEAGVYRIAVQIDKARREIDDLRLITLKPFGEKKDEKIGLYYLGRWPFEGGGTPRSRAYANPSGFIEVTRENKGTPVSEHFKLGDFLTKDQYDVWPKYLVLEPRLLDKLELVIQELQKEGHPVKHVQVMSGFRTPRYNRSGGNTGGRANLSRHMYGDASDVFVDNDGNGTMDDLNRDGRVDAADAKVIADAAERVEARYPALVGGIGVYRACCGHGPFTHIDTRGYRARWSGAAGG